jgi:OST-HTH/LOTUS domain
MTPAEFKRRRGERDSFVNRVLAQPTWHGYRSESRFMVFRVRSSLLRVKRPGGKRAESVQPDFDPRLYGYKKLSDLVKAKSELFVTEERQLPGSNQKVLYLRAK